MVRLKARVIAVVWLAINKLQPSFVMVLPVNSWDTVISGDMQTTKLNMA